jgi:hypothetical protein
VPEWTKGADCKSDTGSANQSDAQQLTSDRQRIPAVDPAVTDESSTTDPELAAVVAAWPDLPEPVRRGIVAMIQAAGGSR